MTKKIFLILVIIFLLINTSVVFSSWYDWSRYEHDGYSFKIPEGYKVSSQLQAEPGDDYLVEDWGCNDPGTRIIIDTNYADIDDYLNAMHKLDINYSESNANVKIRKELIESNDTASIYSVEDRNETIGLFKTENGTTIMIIAHHPHVKGRYSDAVDNYVNIIKGMINSVKKDN